MSAICGIFHMDGKPVQVEMGSAMMHQFSKYHIDASDTWYGGEAFLGCAAQYVTPESKTERLPYIDEEAGLIITADAIIDNRRELFSLMSIPKLQQNGLTDSQLILRAYKKWGAECPKYLAGDFSFAIWNRKEKELFCARDHVGKRTFYFCSSPDTFAFCTVMKPLHVILKNGRELNDGWIADYLSIESIIHEFDCNQTVYKHIQQLPPAHSICLNQNGIKKSQYWYPLEIPELRLKSDSEYEEAFREVFFEAVSCRMRSIGPVGVMLSGGLDSGSVACAAARQLEESGRRLQAYSALPLTDYKNYLPKSLIADESPYIEAIREHVKNIDITYLRSEGKHPLTNVYKTLEDLENPYKFVQNYYWMDEITALAAKNGCKVLLDGQYGNLTISFGEFPTHIISLFRRGRLLSILKEIKGYGRLYNHSYMDVGKYVIRTLFPYSFNRKVEDKRDESLILANPELATRWNVQERFRKAGFGSYLKRNLDLNDVRKLIINPVFFSHTGAVEAKMSLANGIARRDPTRDKRIIEFCLSLPGEQYVREGQERYLIRRAMKGILPEKIRQNYCIRGRQSADWIQRLQPLWGGITEEMGILLQKESIKQYIDAHKLKRVIETIGDNPNGDMWELVHMVIVSLIFSRFVEELQNDAS